MQIAFLFKHEGKDYLVDIFHRLSEHEQVNPKTLHNDKDLRRVLDKSFYVGG